MIVSIPTKTQMQINAVFRANLQLLLMFRFNIYNTAIRPLLYYLFKMNSGSFLLQVSPANPITNKPSSPQKEPRLKFQLPPASQPCYYNLEAKLQPSEFSEDEGDGEGSRTGFEQYQAERRGRLVYRQYDNKGSRRFQRVQYHAGYFFSTADIDTIEERVYPSTSAYHSKDDCLGFDAGFECGNLFEAYRTGQFQYDLILQNDTNSRGNTQWFYFKVLNVKKGTYCFNILNFTKNDSLFGQGQKVLMKKAEATAEWHRVGNVYLYQRSDVRVEGSSRYYYSLSFEIKFEQNVAAVYLAQSYPYSVKRLNRFLSQKMLANSQFLHIDRSSIGRTRSGLDLQLLRVWRGGRKLEERPKIVLFGRQHPGQTQGSYMMEGAIQFLLSGMPQANLLLEKYLFLVFPMLNPDGVINGNYRCNLSGRDLNRCWENPRVSTEAEVCYIFQQLRGKNIQLFVDFHGHSRKKGAFFFSNPNLKLAEEAKMLPFIVSKLNPAVDFKSCTFSVEEERLKAARIVLGDKGRAQGQFCTFQASSFGWVSKQGKEYHFTQDNLRHLGRDVLLGYARKIFTIDPIIRKKHNLIEAIQKISPEEFERTAVLSESQHEDLCERERTEVDASKEKNQRSKNSPLITLKNFRAKKSRRRRKPAQFTETGMQTDQQTQETLRPLRNFSFFQILRDQHDDMAMSEYGFGISTSRRKDWETDQELSITGFKFSPKKVEQGTQTNCQSRRPLRRRNKRQDSRRGNSFLAERKNRNRSVVGVLDVRKLDTARAEQVRGIFRLRFKQVQRQVSIFY